MPSPDWKYCARCGHRDDWHELEGCCVIKEPGAPQCGCREFTAEKPRARPAVPRPERPRPGSLDLLMAADVLREDAAFRRDAAMRHEKAGHKLDAEEVREYAARVARVAAWLEEIA